MRRNYLIIICTLILALLLAMFYTVYGKSKAVKTVNTAEISSKITVVIDPGHGGEDGGTAAADGTVEKDINLAISKMLRDYLELFGVNTVMTREADTAIYDKGTKTIKKQKTSDLHNRMKIVNSTPNSVLISIHQNYYTVPKYNGLQVFYSGNNSQSELLAQLIQSTVAAEMQNDNDRQIKKAESNLYLLHKAASPSVMVECGFMSNKAEAALLNTTEYQQKIAYCIALSVLSYIESN